MTKSSSSEVVNSSFLLRSLAVAVFSVVTFALIGLVASAVCSSVSPKVFESSATVRIEPQASLNPQSSNFAYRHDLLIGEDNIVKKALVKYSLNELPTLRDLSTNNQIRHIQQNFEAQLSKKTNYVYQLHYRSINARDAQTVLATLVSTYEKHLEEKYRDHSQDTIELLLKMKERFTNELAVQIKEVKQIEKEIEAGKNDDDTQARLREFQQKVESIRAKISTAETYLKEQSQTNQTNFHKGFKFTTLSPASRGVSIYPRLPAFLLIGGGVGALIGLVIAGLLIAVLNNRR